MCPIPLPVADNPYLLNLICLAHTAIKQLWIMKMTNKKPKKCTRNHQQTMLYPNILNIYNIQIHGVFQNVFGMIFLFGSRNNKHMNYYTTLRQWSILDYNKRLYATL